MRKNANRIFQVKLGFFLQQVEKTARIGILWSIQRFGHLRTRCNSAQDARICLLSIKYTTNKRI